MGATAPIGWDIFIIVNFCYWRKVYWEFCTVMVNDKGYVFGGA